MCSDPLLRDFYGAGVVQAESTVDEVPLLAIDFETTGMDPQHDAIISIGAIPFTLRAIRCREAQQWLVQPDRKLREKGVTLHGITHAELNAARPFTEVLETLLPYLATQVVVVHYHPLERLFLERAVEEVTGEKLRFPMIDTMVLEKQQLQQQQPLLQRLFHRPLPSSLRLGDCRRRYRLPHYRPHDALTDALATAELFLAQMSHHYPTAVRVGRLWC
ncbi:MAG: 3'-5' exonuclease [Gammaproteobacteria bacterium]|nr:3'-5' exonuclease [Gammaproteobacteria bacterium]